MTLEEKVKFIKESKEKNNLFISPRIIQGGATLVYDYKTLELYENIDENTKKFAEKEIVILISNANSDDKEVNNYLKFNLIFCGDFDDLPNNIGSPAEFIMNYKEKIVAVYKYVKSTEQREFFCGFTQSEIINNYGYLYLNFAKLVEEFEKNNIKFEIDPVVDRFTPARFRDDTVTNFVISYNPIKEIKTDKVKKITKKK